MSRSTHEVFEAINSNELNSNEYLSWINLHLSMNDVLYPALSTPAAGGDVLEATLLKDIKSQIPLKVATPVTSLSRFSPTVINHASSTLIHTVVATPSRASSSRQRSRNYDPLGSEKMDAYNPHDGSSVRNVAASVGGTVTDSDLESISQDFGITADAFMDQDGCLPDSPVISPWKQKSDDGSEMLLHGDEDIDQLQRQSSSFRSSQRHMGGLGSSRLDLLQYSRSSTTEASILKPDITLPQLYVNYSRGARLYLLSPYYSGSITGCIDCQIIVGSVYGALIVNGCERTKITASCRKLIVINCLECEFNIASVSASVVIGDSRNLSFGPHNAAFRSLGYHLKLAMLTELLSLNHSRWDAETSKCNFEKDEKHIPSSASTNSWSLICDVNACLEVSKSYSNGGLGVICESALNVGFPVPSITTAIIQTPDKFRVLSIPLRTEHLSIDHHILGIPSSYIDYIKQEQEKFYELQHRLVYLLHQQRHPSASSGEHSTDMMQSSFDVDHDNDNQDLTAKILTSSVISKRFMEWLVATDNIHELLDLIK
jgi:hypothetical protein